MSATACASNGGDASASASATSTVEAVASAATQTYAAAFATLASCNAPPAPGPVSPASLTCVLLPNTNLNGDVVESTTAADAGACCELWWVGDGCPAGVCIVWPPPPVQARSSSERSPPFLCHDASSLCTSWPSPLLTWLHVSRATKAPRRPGARGVSLVCSRAVHIVCRLLPVFTATLKTLSARLFPLCSKRRTGCNTFAYCPLPPPGCDNGYGTFYRRCACRCCCCCCLYLRSCRRRRRPADG